MIFSNSEAHYSYMILWLPAYGLSWFPFLDLVVGGIKVTFHFLIHVVGEI